MTNEDLAIRLARIEEKVNNIEKQVLTMSTGSKYLTEQLYQVSQDTTTALNSTKSAHKRLDDLKATIAWAVGLSATVVGIFASILTSVLMK
jgi:tetrahydromethanopterin S-methyltransferase subunit G